LLGQAWVAKDSEVRASNIVALTAKFNSLSWWVVQSILDQKTPKLRAERITKIIEVGMV
jgi:hypothetical protein